MTRHSSYVMFLRFRIGFVQSIQKLETKLKNYLFILLHQNLGVRIACFWPHPLNGVGKEKTQTKSAYSQITSCSMV